MSTWHARWRAKKLEEEEQNAQNEEPEVVHQNEGLEEEKQNGDLPEKEDPNEKLSEEEEQSEESLEESDHDVGPQEVVHVEIPLECDQNEESDEEKVKTEVTEPEVRKELKRGSMKEKWGLTLSYNFEDSRLSVGVIKVSMFSPAAKAGVSAGSIINVINDWAIEAMDKPEVAMSILLAAGFSVNLAWRSTKDDISSWKKLDMF